jgi:phospholipase/lecithinase/hemolysin
MPPDGETETGVGYDALVVFGDSLSDVGHAGRFSNGPVWVEYLAQHWGAALRPSREGGTNYAVGGARTPDLRRQAAEFIRGGAAPGARPLFVVYGGANDLRAAGYDRDPLSVPGRAAANIAAILADLAAAGAREALVPNLPDIGLTLESRMVGPEIAQLGRMASELTNRALDAALDRVAATTRLRIHRLDVFALHHAVVADPASFGFENLSEPALGRPDPDRYLFWDRIHPTTAAHKRLAEAALRALDQS